MAISCDPSDVANAARCWSSCIPDQLAVRSYLLCQYEQKTECTPPGAPTGLESSIFNPPTHTTISVDWTASTGTKTGYVIKWGLASGNYNVGSANVGAATLNFTITGLTPGTPYFIAVFALNGANCSSGASNELNVSTVANNGLLNNLVHYWKFDALNVNSGVDDSVGTLNTSSTNLGADMSLNAGGIINSCVSCTAAGAVNQLIKNAPLDLDVKPLFAGDGSISLSLWIWLDVAGAQTAGFPMTMSVWGAAGGEQWYFLFVVNGTSVPVWRMKNNIGGTVDLAWGAGITRQAWHLVVMGYDGTAGKSFLSVDNGALIYSAAFVPTGNNNAGNFGFFNANSQNNEWAGRNDECGIWNPRALTQANINSLWNGGAGLPFGSFTN
jgi:hypothetical protein